MKEKRTLQDALKILVDWCPEITKNMLKKDIEKINEILKEYEKTRLNNGK